MFLKFLLLFAFLIPSFSAFAYDYPSDERECKITVLIVIERDGLSQHEARKACDDLNSHFRKGCHIRKRGYGKYAISLRSTTVYKGIADSWSKARSLAFQRYERFATRSGFGKKWPHHLTFSKCG